MSLYQQQRQQLKDKIIGLAASLAGLRSNLTHNSKSIEEVREVFKTNSQLLEVSTFLVKMLGMKELSELRVTYTTARCVERRWSFEMMS